VNAGAGSYRPKRNLARGPIAGRQNAPRGSVAGAGSDAGAGSGRASGAPQLGRDTSPSQWQSPAIAPYRSRPGVLLPVYVPAICQIRHSASRDAMHRSRCGTGDYGAAIRRAVASMLASDCLLFRVDCGPNATERIPQRPRDVFGAEPAGRKVASGNCGNVIGAEADAPSGAIAGT
jgi:hypothetical protein